MQLNIVVGFFHTYLFFNTVLFNKFKMNKFIIELVFMQLFCLFNKFFIH